MDYTFILYKLKYVSYQALYLFIFFLISLFFLNKYYDWILYFIFVFCGIFFTFGFLYSFNYSNNEKKFLTNKSKNIFSTNIFNFLFRNIFENNNTNINTNNKNKFISLYNFIVHFIPLLILIFTIPYVFKTKKIIKTKHPKFNIFGLFFIVFLINNLFISSYKIYKEVWNLSYKEYIQIVSIILISILITVNNIRM